MCKACTETVHAGMLLHNLSTLRIIGSLKYGASFSGLDEQEGSV